MNYLINNHIIYDSRQGLLYANTHNIGEEIKLTITLNRLLLVLVQNNNEILDRKTLLDRVWRDHNQVVSDNNFNNSLSVLRRHLSSFSDDDFITTLPKIGIKFSAIIDFKNEDIQNEHISETEISDNENQSDLLVQVLNKEIQNQPDLTPKYVNHDIPSDLEPLPQISNEVILDNKAKNLDEKIKSPAKKAYVLNNRNIEIALICTITFYLLYLFKIYFFTNKIEYPVVGQIDQCTIRYINSYHKPDVRLINFSLLKERLASIDIDCKKSSTVYYYNVGIVTNDRNISKDYAFIAYCPNTPKNNTTVSCENFYVK